MNNESTLPFWLPTPGEHSCEENNWFGAIFMHKNDKELDRGKQAIQSTSCWGGRLSDSLGSGAVACSHPHACCSLCKSSWNPGPGSQPSPLRLPHRAISSFLVLLLKSSSALSLGARVSSTHQLASCLPEQPTLRKHP